MEEEVVWFDGATSRGWEPIAGTVVGELVVHRTISSQKTFSVSHRYTGMGLGVELDSKGKAMEFAVIANSMADWSGVTRGEQIGVVNFKGGDLSYKLATQTALRKLKAIG